MTLLISNERNWNFMLRHNHQCPLELLMRWLTTVSKLYPSLIWFYIEGLDTKPYFCKIPCEIKPIILTSKIEQGLSSLQCDLGLFLIIMHLSSASPRGRGGVDGGNWPVSCRVLTFRSLISRNAAKSFLFAVSLHGSHHMFSNSVMFQNFGGIFNHVIARDLFQTMRQYCLFTRRENFPVRTAWRLNREVIHAHLGGFVILNAELLRTHTLNEFSSAQFSVFSSK